MAAMFFCLFFFATYEVRMGVQIAVVMHDAATSGVAINDAAWRFGSSRATVAGVATEFPAVLDAAAPAMPVPPVFRSARILK